jgi:hypothetical protein
MEEGWRYISMEAAEDDSSIPTSYCLAQTYQCFCEGYLRTWGILARASEMDE